jgi:hypothetical protein
MGVLALILEKEVTLSKIKLFRVQTVSAYC